MCEPTTLMMASLALTAGSGLYGAAAANEAGKAEQRAADQNAAVARNQSEQAKQIGNIEEERQLRRVRAALGTQRATLAANGLDVNSGTALDLQAETAGFGAADALNLRANALRQAWGFDVEAVNQTNRGRAARAAGRNQAIGTLLTTASSMTGQAYSGGMFGGKSTAAPRKSYNPGRLDKSGNPFTLQG
jgi:hypothetical protein